MTDTEGLARLGAPPDEVSRLINETFAEMVFTWGDVHADPHPANLLVRRTPPPADDDLHSRGGWQGGVRGRPRGSWQLVLLDHGLYRRLDDSFRLEYAGLWHSLVFAGGCPRGAGVGVHRAAHACPTSCTCIKAGLCRLRGKAWDPL